MTMNKSPEDLAKKLKLFGPYKECFIKGYKHGENNTLEKVFTIMRKLFNEKKLSDNDYVQVYYDKTIYPKAYCAFERLIDDIKAEMEKNKNE